jgi:hypothetical protein
LVTLNGVVGRFGSSVATVAPQPASSVLNGPLEAFNVGNGPFATCCPRPTSGTATSVIAVPTK